MVVVISREKRSVRGDVVGVGGRGGSLFRKQLGGRGTYLSGVCVPSDDTTVEHDIVSYIRSVLVLTVLWSRSLRRNRLRLRRVHESRGRVHVGVASGSVRPAVTRQHKPFIRLRLHTNISLRPALFCLSARELFSVLR